MSEKSNRRRASFLWASRHASPTRHQMAEYLTSWRSHDVSTSKWEMEERFPLFMTSRIGCHGNKSSRVSSTLTLTFGPSSTFSVRVWRRWRVGTQLSGLTPVFNYCGFRYPHTKCYQLVLGRETPGGKTRERQTAIGNQDSVVPGEWPGAGEGSGYQDREGGL